MSDQPAWTEADSVNFIDSGRIYTPRRDGLQQAFLDAIPAEPKDSFLAVDIGSGAGWLTAAILQTFPNARVVALDGSATMRTETLRTCAAWNDRLRVSNSWTTSA